MFAIVYINIKYYLRKSVFTKETSLLYKPLKFYIDNNFSASVNVCKKNSSSK